jgi:hypothetical protein
MNGVLYDLQRPSYAFPKSRLPFGHVLQLELLKQLAHGLFVRSWGILSVLLLDFRDYLIDDSWNRL